MNSAIDELIPAPVRGTVDLVVNGSYWLGTILCSVGSLFFLNQELLNVSPNVSWRLMFVIGAVLGILIVILRLYLPEVSANIPLPSLYLAIIWIGVSNI